MQRRTFLVGTSAALGSAFPLLAAEKPEVIEYGHLRGRFVYDGDPPESKLLELSGEDKEVLNKLKLIDESLLVHPENRGIANAVVWLHVVRGEKLNVHPSLARGEREAPAAKIMRIEQGRFTPRVVVLRTDEPFVLQNDDPRTSAPAFPWLENNPENGELLPREKSLTFHFRQPESLPVPLVCRIYPWMKANVVIQEHPYVAVADAAGRFELLNIPAGKHTFRLWHERCGVIRTATINGAMVEWPRGLAIEIHADETIDLGDIEIPAQIF